MLKPIVVRRQIGGVVSEFWDWQTGIAGDGTGLRATDYGIGHDVEVVAVDAALGAGVGALVGLALKHPGIGAIVGGVVMALAGTMVVINDANKIVQQSTPAQ
jgi:hypothetical protein